MSIAAPTAASNKAAVGSIGTPAFAVSYVGVLDPVEKIGNLEERAGVVLLPAGYGGGELVAGTL